MRAILTMAIKDLLLLWRDRFGVFWILLFPLMFALFFGTLFGGVGESGGAGMSIAFVDLDASDNSRAFIELLDEKQAIDAAPPPEGREAWDADSARRAVLAGDVVAWVVLPEGFGEGGPMSMFTAEPPEIELGVDPSRVAEKSILEGLLMEASFRRLQGLFTDPASMKPDLAQLKADVASDPDMTGPWRATLTTLFDSLDTFASMADEAIDQEQGSDDGDDAGPDFAPVKIRHVEVTREGARPLNAFEISFPQAIIWGIIGCAAGLAMMLVQEKTRGTWTRLRLGPVTTTHILLSKGLSCLFACALAITFLLLVGHLLLGVRVGSWPAFVMAVGSSAACFTGLMMIFATLGRTEQAVAGWAWGAMMPMAMVGGGMVPLMMMPSWLRSVSDLSPVKWSVYSMEGAIWRGFGIGQMLVPCAVLLAIGAAGCLFGIVILRRREL